MSKACQVYVRFEEFSGENRCVLCDENFSFKEVWRLRCGRRIVQKQEVARGWLYQARSFSQRKLIQSDPAQFCSRWLVPDRCRWASQNLQKDQREWFGC